MSSTISHTRTVLAEQTAGNILVGPSNSPIQPEPVVGGSNRTPLSISHVKTMHPHPYFDRLLVPIQFGPGSELDYNRTLTVTLYTPQVSSRNGEDDILQFPAFMRLFLEEGKD